MPPKRRGRPPKESNGRGIDSIDFGNTTDSSVVMSGRNSRSRAKGKGKASSSRNAVPDVYEEMLAEALPSQSDIPERPLKRRKTGRRDAPVAANSPAKPDQSDDVVVDEEDEDEDLEFEDVLDTAKDGDSENESNLPPKQVQTAYRDSDGEESGESDLEWEGIDFDAKPGGGEEPSGDLELILTVQPTPQRRAAAPRRKAVTNAERTLRLEIHRMHVLCLLSHLDRRNTWCNDPDVRSALEPLLDKKTLTYLNPKESLSQFGRAESLKRGLEMASVMWRTKFNITARGIRRALWADDEKDIQNYKPSDDADPPFEKSDFREAAKKLKGSRDLGAQLYCALLRSAGVETRLVCSLQPLTFNAGGPPMPRRSASAMKSGTPEVSNEGEAVDIRATASPFGINGPSTASVLPSPRRRLGHPNAGVYHLPEMNAPPPPPPRPKRKVIHESPYPVFWVEVFDEAHQKWFPVDPLVTETVAKPRTFEPPAADRENNMSYVIAFEEEGCARDVTRRYTKAYNAKTRKQRVECTTGGQKWWRKSMRAYRRAWVSDSDQIEDTELVAAEAREPMPKNIADFKDHPVYALERHLRRNEVLTSTHASGKVAAGRDSGTPGGKKMENVYRRRDVKIARSADAWYRLGREVKMGEQPIKTVAPKGKCEDGDGEDDVDEGAGTNLYTEDQTRLYVAPPIVNGRVPKNSFGNLDVYVPSMVPKGGVHLPYDEASRAARLLGIDYADALTGFEFRGRHGTAVLKGVVVAIEYCEAVEAIIEGFADEHAKEEEQRRTFAALRMWRHFIMGLRIKQRVDAYEIEGEARVEEKRQEKRQAGGDKEDGDGGFVPEDSDDDEGGGGFVPDDDGDDEVMQSEEYFSDGAGGFFPE